MANEACFEACFYRQDPALHKTAEAHVRNFTNEDMVAIHRTGALRGRPVYEEHEPARGVKGQIERTWQAGDNHMARLRITDSAAVQRILNGELPEVSLAHERNWDTSKQLDEMNLLEVSLCRKGKRPGTRITHRVEASAEGGAVNTEYVEWAAVAGDFKPLLLPTPVAESPAEPMATPNPPPTQPPNPAPVTNAPNPVDMEQYRQFQQFQLMQQMLAQQQQQQAAQLAQQQAAQQAAQQQAAQQQLLAQQLAAQQQQRIQTPTQQQPQPDPRFETLESKLNQLLARFETPAAASSSSSAAAAAAASAAAVSTPAAAQPADTGRGKKRPEPPAAEAEVPDVEMNGTKQEASTPQQAGPVSKRLKIQSEEKKKALDAVLNNPSVAAQVKQNLVQHFADSQRVLIEQEKQYLDRLNAITEAWDPQATAEEKQALRESIDNDPKWPQLLNMYERKVKDAAASTLAPTYDQSLLDYAMNGQMPVAGQVAVAASASKEEAPVQPPSRSSYLSVMANTIGDQLQPRRLPDHERRTGGPLVTWGN